MLITIDGRRIRASKRVTYTVAGMTPDGRHVFLTEHHADGTTLAGPTVTAAEWHRQQGNLWITCTGSRRRPSRTKVSEAGGHWTSARCATCGAWDGLRKDGTVWAHKRPAGHIFDNDGVQVVTPIRRYPEPTPEGESR